MIEMSKPVTEQDFRQFLVEALTEAVDEFNDDVTNGEFETEQEEDEAIANKIDLSHRTFEEACYLTNDTGLVVTINGRKFNVTIQEERS